MALTTALAATRASPLLFLTAHFVFKFKPLSSSYSSSATSRKLILYSKPGCCLCNGLKEKLQAAFLISGSILNCGCGRGWVYCDGKLRENAADATRCCCGDFQNRNIAITIAVAECNLKHCLRIRDITTNPEWERAFQYEIPVLVKVLSDGT